jgi:replicative DNA helicase
LKPDSLDTRGLPEAIETERLVLSALLKNTLDYRDCRAVLDPSDFALEAHRIIYRHLGELCDAGMGLDTCTIGERLHAAGELQSTGGLSYIVDLDRNYPSISRCDDHIRIVRDKSILRRTIQIADSIRTDAILQRQDASELLGRAERMLADLGMQAARSSEFQQPGEVIRAAGGLDSYLNRGVQLGVPSGFPGLDEMTCGLRPGQLWVLAAGTGVGKSTFARCMTLNAARANFPGAFITLEMTSDEVTDGLICAAGGINTQVIRRGVSFERDRTRAAAHEIADLPIYIRDAPGATIPKLYGELRKLKSEKGILWAVVDYLQLMTPVGRFGTRTEEVGHLTRGLKLIAADLKIGVMALSQINREAGKVARKPVLSDLRESGSIEQDANLVMFLHSEWQAHKMEIYPTELIIAKQRGGSVGMKMFGFRKSTGSFIEMEGGNDGH